MFNNLRSGTGTIDTIEVNLNPKRKFLYVDNDNFITPSTTAGISQVGFTDDIEITNETTNPSIALYSSTGLNPKIDFIRGSRTFGNDASTDWRIQNNGSTYLSFTSGKNSVITEEMRVSETDLELTTVDLKIATGNKAQSEKYTGLSTSTNFDLGLTGDAGIINSFRDITVASGKKITTPIITVSSLTPSKIVLTNGDKDLVSSSYTDTDFPRLTANNTMSGNNIFSGANIFTGGITTTTSNQVLNLNNSDSLRNLFRFYTPVYQNVSNQAVSNPQILFNTSVNGMEYYDGSWSLNAYTPVADNVVIPNGQPYYFRNLATLTTTFNTDRTNLTSAVQMTTGKVIIFMYNTNTSLYEFIGIVNNTSIPTSNQFNSRINSFTLPTSRGSNNNILTSNGSGSSTWASSISTGNISSSGSISTNKIDGLATSGNTLNICNTSDTTSSISLNRDTTLNTNKNLTLQGTGKITTPNILVSNLTPNKLVLTNGSNDLVSSSFSDTDFPKLTANNTFTGINTFTNATPILTDKIDGTANTANNLNIGNTSDTTSTIRLNRDTFIGTTASNKYLRTDLLSGLRNVSNIFVGESGDTGDIDSYRDFEIIDNTKGIFTNRLASRKATLPNNETLNIGFTDAVNYTGVISLNQNTEVPVGRNIKTSNLQSNTATTNLLIGSNLSSGQIQLGTLGTMTGNIICNSDIIVGSTSNNKGIACNYYSTLTATDNAVLFPISTTGTLRIAQGLTTGSLFIGQALTTGSLNLHNSAGTGVINTNADLIFPTTKRIRVDRIVGTTPLTSNINIGYTDPSYVANILLNQNVVVDTTRSLALTSLNSNGTGLALQIGSNILNNIITIGNSITTGGVYLGNSSATGCSVFLQNDTYIPTANSLSCSTIKTPSTDLTIGQTGDRVIVNGQKVNIGTGAGTTTQGSFGIAIGNLSAGTNQGYGAVSIGLSSSTVNQGISAVSIGESSNSRANQSIAIGKNANISDTGGVNSICIGHNALSIYPNSIVLNASGSAVSASSSGFYVRSLRNRTGTHFANYDTGNYEIGYATSGQKYKNNIIKLERNFDDVLKLRSVEYNFKRDNVKCIGYIAEQLYDVNPEFAIYQGDEPDAIDWFNIIVYQNEVVKENRTRIENLEKIQNNVGQEAYNDLQNKYNDLENKYNNLSTELQKIKDLLIFKFGDVL